MSDVQKQQYGGRASVCWIGTSIYLFATNDPGLVSWQFAAFLVIGMFASSIIIGGLLYAGQRMLAKTIARTSSVDAATGHVSSTVNAFAFVWTILSFAISIAAAILAFNALF